MTAVELHAFYECLVRELRTRGVLCGVTSGLACVHFGVAETTRDCALLCHGGHFGLLLKVLSETPLNGLPCRYRGHLSPPLDDEWHRGGWTSHFQWGDGPEAVTLDVFGRALRGSTRWEHELAGLYVSPHVVSEMKRTERDKDWPFITALGERLLEAGDPRGWLHLFDAGTIRRLLKAGAPPQEIIARRPALRLAVAGDPQLDGALMVERQFWARLDHLRIAIYRRALRPYNLAVIRAGIPEHASLHESHEARLACARACLSRTPLQYYGVERLVSEARAEAVRFFRPEAAAWLPDAAANFNYLRP